jgi:hypothetical protein
MTPAKINLIIYQGTTFKKDIQWLIGTPPIPVDITGYTFRMQIREKIKDTIFLIELTTENSKIIITSATEGRFSLVLTATETSLLNFKSAVYDLEVITPSGNVSRFCEGSVQLSLEVTR